MSATQNAPEFQIRVDRNPAEPASGSKFAKAKQANEALAPQIRQRREEIHRMHREETSARQTLAENEAAVAQANPPPPRENIESIEFTAPNGMLIVYGPPTGISLVDRIARLYPGRDTSMAEFRLTRILMGVRSIDGVQMQPIVDEIGRTALANRLGDENIDLLMYYDRTHFPALRQAEVPQIKKNLR